MCSLYFKFKVMGYSFFIKDNFLIYIGQRTIYFYFANKSFVFSNLQIRNFEYLIE